MKILHVEDDPFHAHLTQRLLRMLPVELIQVQTADDALALLASEPIDLLMTDVALAGGIDGFTLVEYLRETPPFQTLKVIFMSAVDGLSATARAGQLDALAYLLKPVQPETLLTILQHLLSQQGGANPAK